MRRAGNRIISLICAAALCAGLLTVPAVAAEPAGEPECETDGYLSLGETGEDEWDGLYVASLGMCAHGEVVFADSDELTLEFAPGDEVTVELYPDDLYTTTEIIVTMDDSEDEITSEINEGDTVFTFTMPDEDVMISAVFEGGAGEEYTVELSEQEGIDIAFVNEDGEPIDDSEYEAGDIVRVNASVEDGYEATDGITFKIDDTTIEADECIDDITVVFCMPEKDIEIEPETEVEQQSIGLRLFASSKTYTFSGNWSVFVNLTGTGWSKLKMTVAKEGTKFRITVSNTGSSDSFTWSAKQKHLSKLAGQSGRTTYSSLSTSGKNPCVISTYTVSASTTTGYQPYVSVTAKHTTLTTTTVYGKTDGGSSSDSSKASTTSSSSNSSSGSSSSSSSSSSNSSSGSSSSSSSKGYLTLTKSSSRSDWVSNNSNYSLKGAEYKVYTDSSCSTRAKDTSGNKATLTVKSDGTTNKLTMKAGTYYLKETTAAPGHKADSLVHKATVSKNSTTTVKTTSSVVPAYLTLDATAKGADFTADNDCYNIKGAQYTVYYDAACTKAQTDSDGNTATLTTKEDGTCDAVAVPVGTLYVKETRESEGYLLCGGDDACEGSESGVHTVKLTTGNTASSPAKVECVNNPAYDAEGLYIKKVDAETGESAPQSAASFSGAQFTVGYYAGYYDGETLPDAPAREWVIETKYNLSEDVYKAALSDGYKVSGDEWYTYEDKNILPLGTYTVQETEAPEGYLLEGAPTTSASWASEHNYTAPVHIGQIVLKSNAVQSLSFPDNEAEETSVSEESGSVDTGAVAAEETAAKDSGDVSNEDLGADDEAADGSADGETDPENTEDENTKSENAEPATPNLVVRENVKRFELSLEKTDEEGEGSTGSVEFEITSLTTGETHRFWTDADGDYISNSEENPHTYETDEAVDEHSGLWFYGTEDTTGQDEDSVSDSLGALPYDAYTIKEIEGENNTNAEMFSTTIEFTNEDYAGYVYNVAYTDAGYAAETIADSDGTTAAGSGTDSTDGTSTGTSLGGVDLSGTDSTDGTSTGTSLGGVDLSGTDLAASGSSDTGGDVSSDSLDTSSAQTGVYRYIWIAVIVLAAAACVIIGTVVWRRKRTNR